MQAVEQHGGRSEDAKGGKHKADVGDTESGDFLDDGRGGEVVGISGGQEAHVDDAYEPDARVAKGWGDGFGWHVCAVARYSGEDGGALGFGEPGRVGGAVGENVEEGAGEDDGGEGFDQEEPLPAAEAESPVKGHERSGERAHDDGAARERDVEARDRAGSHVRRIPLPQVEDDSWKEAGFGHAQEEAGDVELHRGADEHHSHRNHAPRDHDAAEPFPRTEAVEHEVGWYLAGRVAEEEEARAEAVNSVREVKVAVHLQRGVTDVDAVHVSRAVAQSDERN